MQNDMTQTQYSYLGATCGNSTINWISNDNATFGVETNGKTEYMPIIQAGKRFGTWHLRTKRIFVSKTKLNGHHGAEGWGITDPKISTEIVTILESMVQEKVAA
jgi:hypothetical protein